MDYRKAIEYFERELNYKKMALSPLLDGKESLHEQYLKTAISAMQELQQYEQLGTLEEVREAVEKQRKVKPEDGEYCPICHTFLKDEDDVPGFYCMNCGQAIDWSGEYEIN